MTDTATSKSIDQRKATWIDDCADQYISRAGVSHDESIKLAQATWEASVADEGSEEAVLDNVAPEIAADDDMDCWDGDQDAQ